MNTPTSPTHQARGLQIPRPTTAPVLAIAGAKGGVGKTMLATNLALLLARAGHRTLLVDFDPGCGNIGVHLRLSATTDLDDIANGDAPVRAALVDGPAGLSVLLGRSGSNLLASDDDRPRRRALQAILDARTDFDVVVIDTGAGIGPATLQVVDRADLVLGVTTPDAAALTDAYALCKVMHRRGQTLPRLVVNRVKNRDEAMRTIARLTAVARKFLAADVPTNGWVSDDPNIELAIRDQRPLALFGQGQGLDDLRGVCAAALAGLPPLARRQASAEPAPRIVRLRPGVGGPA